MVEVSASATAHPSRAETLTPRGESSPRPAAYAQMLANEMYVARATSASCSPNVPICSESSAAAARTLIMISDPMLLLRAVQLQVQNRQTAEQAQDIDQQSTLAEQAAERQRLALEAAERAARSASSFLGLPGWLGDLVEKIAMAAVAVVAVAAAVVTGGVGAALLIAGLVLVLAAEPLAEGAAAAGIIDKSDIEALALGLKIAGSALMMGVGAVSAVGAATAGANVAAGAGAGASAATSGASAGASVASSASAAIEVAETAQTIAQVVGAAAATAQGADRIHGTAATYDERVHRTRAAVEADDEETARDGVEASIDETRRLLALFQRVGERIQQASTVQAETREAAIRAIA